ncbi:MAG: NUDIX hydrolase [Candidatus Krumholzibacteria bacterium]|nr:NUDIX hydrolase [Candidatus Krumholzibacteria bacterium]MDH4336022.1 NUDIX hydrolase [Candidatus Krumholzibacteria bacterium]MDH5268402.1 NUDIX hydrolase [Candidatus Krumholzibacteria bacterium]
MFMLIALIVLVSVVVPAGAQDLPEGYAPLTTTQPIIDKTLHVHLAPDLSPLTGADQLAVDYLIQAGEIFQQLHENMKHRQATGARTYLVDTDRNLGSPPATQNLLTLYYMSNGPVVRGLDNVRRPVLPVDPPVPGGALYPWDVTREELDAFMKDHPDEVETILHPRTVVRRCTVGAVNADLAALNRHRDIEKAHPDLKPRLIELSRHPDRVAFYAVPYPVAYADELARVSGLLKKAADAVKAEDPDFAGYLRARANDLIINDYAAGDSAWVTGSFKNLNAQIGSYETYDDALFGVKTYFSLNVLLRDHERSDALRSATAALQTLEDSLPYDKGKPHKRVRTDIPVGVYEVVADFAQSRGTNTATILPNEASSARKYGRTILLRHNIMTNPDLFENQRRSYVAVMDAKFANDLIAEGNANRTLWHEIGHYLGVDRTRDDRDLDLALGQAAAVYEEMKADLVSLYVIPTLLDMKFYTADAARSVYASGVRRVLLKNKPERAQAYQTMELMQFNYFLAQGAFTFDAAAGKLSVDYARMHAAATAMLGEVLEIQAAGDAAAAEAYIARWTTWRDDLHERMAAAMRDAEQHRFAYVTYQSIENVRK